MIVFIDIWDPMGVKLWQNATYSTYKVQPKVLKLVPNFPPNSPHKTTLGIFELSNFKFPHLAYGEIKNLNYL